MRKKTIKATKNRCFSAVLASILGAFGFVGDSLASDANVKATFAVSLSGIQIGRGNLEATLSDQTYSVGVAAKITGIARLVAGGEGSATARGNFAAGKLNPVSYKINNSVSDLRNSVSLGLKNNRIVSENVYPPTPPNPYRVPITEASKSNVIDPLSAFLIPVVNGANPMDPSTCDRALNIYDGRQRYTIAMAYSRTEYSRGTGDFEGPTLVCKAAWRPVAGHRTDTAEAKMMEENRDVEAWLTPVPNTNFLIISRFALGTVAGKLVVNTSRVSVTVATEATAFQLR